MARNILINGDIYANVPGAHFEQVGGGPGVLFPDTSGDTVTAGTLNAGVTAHDASGALITGQQVIQDFYVRSSVPTSAFGNDGDLCLVEE